QALRRVYHKPVTADGPAFSRALREGNVLRVYFTNAGEGLEARGDLKGFETAGPDGVHHPASAVIEGETVLVSAEDVAEPEQVRYGWIKYGPVPLFAKNGLPAMPFRGSCR
ncbi:MAG: hypothetical protein LBP20_04000, partial [Treponema sp.]|nr:hypothetical protein [Treponema sp.]